MTESIIKTMDKNDSINKIAHLIYDTSSELSRALFGNKIKAIPRIERLIKLENNLYSYKNILIAKEGNDIKGILIGYDVATINKKEMNNDFKKAMPFWARLRCLLLLNNSNHIMDFDGISGFYIQNLCVDSKSRGKRISHKLLANCIETNKEKSIDTYLDLESTNDIALGLYKKLGFKIIREKNIKVAGVTLYRMRYCS